MASRLERSVLVADPTTAGSMSRRKRHASIPRRGGITSFPAATTWFLCRPSECAPLLRSQTQRFPDFIASASELQTLDLLELRHMTALTRTWRLA
jgi:hypothetical protein